MLYDAIDTRRCVVKFLLFSRWGNEWKFFTPWREKKIWKHWKTSRTSGVKLVNAAEVLFNRNRRTKKKNKASRFDALPFVQPLFPPCLPPPTPSTSSAQTLSFIYLFSSRSLQSCEVWSWQNCRVKGAFWLGRNSSRLVCSRKLEGSQRKWSTVKGNGIGKKSI